MLGMRVAFVMVLILAGIFGPLRADAQPKTVHIGYLAADLPANPHFPAAFREGLRELGYVEGQNVVIEYRSADGHSERLSHLAAELVSHKVDILLSEGTPPSLAAKQATTTIPIVFAASADAIGSGLVASLARPGGNVTGLSFLGPETVGKSLQLLKETLPGILRVAVLSHPGNPTEATRKLLLRET